MKIIGICGPSGSGKSTVAEIFAQKLNAEIVHTDAFFKEPSRAPLCLRCTQSL